MSDYQVSAEALELRSGPGTAHPILERLPRGSEVAALAPPDATGWMQVRRESDGRTGWCAARYLRPLSAPAAAPPVAPAAAPESVPQAPPASPRSAPTPGPAAAPLAKGALDAEAGLVFDISHYNGSVDFAAAYQAGQRGVIHKATEGLHYVDAKFHANRQQATAAGLLFGAYHFGTGDDPIAQAEHFLATVEPDGKTLLILDWEPNPQGRTMSLAQARAFISHLQQKTGRWPGLYSGSTARESLGGRSDPVLGQCWLWLAEYSAEPLVPPAWGGWTLWQHTDGTHGPGPHELPGVGRCDRSRFAGDAAALAAFWASHS